MSSTSLSSDSDADSEQPNLPSGDYRDGPHGSGSAAAATALGRGRGSSSTSSSGRGSSSDGMSSSDEGSARCSSDSDEASSESEEGGSGGNRASTWQEGAAEDEDADRGLAWNTDGSEGSYSSQAEDDSQDNGDGRHGMLQQGDAGEEGGSGGLPPGMLERLRLLMALQGAGPPQPPIQRHPLLPSVDLQGVAEFIRSGRARHIICMCGAGISVSAGIPDFRSPGTGLYHRLEEYGLPHPQAVFELEYFKSNPRPFFLLAKELFPGVWRPTPAHYFMRLLHAKGLLLRCYTQNIDSLEHQAGLPRSAVVAAHGNFDSAHCIRCGQQHSVEHVRQAVFAGDGHPCICRRKRCGGLVKPDIVFFGEALPRRFFESVPRDFPQTDLLIVMGSSLVVHPFASLIDEVDEDTPRLLINREPAGEGHPLLRALGYRTGGFCFEAGHNYRDAFFQGDCDEGVRQLCRLLGWEGELAELIEAGPCPPSPELSEAGGSPSEGPSLDSQSDSQEAEATQAERRRRLRAQRRRHLHAAVGSMLALPGRRARRLLQIRLLHSHVLHQRRRLRRMAQQMRRLGLEDVAA